MKNCGNCKYHLFMQFDNEYLCASEKSEHYRHWTDDDCSCEEWTEKEDSKLEV